MNHQDTKAALERAIGEIAELKADYRDLLDNRDRLTERCTWLENELRRVRSVLREVET